MRERLGEDSDGLIGVTGDLDESPGHPSRNALAFVLGEREVGDLDPAFLRRRLERTRTDHSPVLFRQIADPRADEPRLSVHANGGFAHRPGHLGQRQFFNGLPVSPDLDQPYVHRLTPSERIK